MDKKKVVNELVKIAKEINASDYFRLSKGFRGSQIYVLEKHVEYFFSIVKRGDDISPELIDSIIEKFKKAKDNMKRFKSGEDVPDEYK